MSSRNPNIKETVYPGFKNILVIDGARNCAYDIFAATPEEFKIIFPGDGQDIEFMEDIVQREDEDTLKAVFFTLWKRRVDKKKVDGIHGTLFYELGYKKQFYPTKKDQEMI